VHSRNDDRRGHRLDAVLATAMLLALGLSGCSDGGEAALVERQAEVAQRGAAVMGFDLDSTTHRFETTDSGLVQSVTADDPGDEQQIRLVREHLAEQATRFAEGDFDDPAAIHGHDMPGLAELRTAAGAIHIELQQLDAGARMIFTTEDPALIDALHRWAHAQRLDHGAHAEHGSH
jgi:hypothetical protein